MATAAEIKKAYGITSRGALARERITAWDAEHPEDPYQPGPPRDTNGHAPDYPDDDFESMFPELGAVDGDVAAGTIADTRETPPRRPKARGGTTGRGSGPLGFLAGRKKKTGHNRRKVPRVSTEGLIGAAWRGAAAMLGPVPPLQRTLRMQAPVAGMLLDDTVKDTFIDPFLQPIARMAEQGKTVQALVGPPAFVTAIMTHTAQRAAMDPPQEPHPLFMTLAMEGLRSSLGAWAEVAGPKFELAMEREKEFEAKHGQTIDAMIAMIFAPPVNPADVDAVVAEEEAIRRAQGIL